MRTERLLEEVDVSQLTRGDWWRIVWGVLWRGSPYTLPPLLVVLVAVIIFGAVLAAIALQVGISPQTIEDNELTLELAGDLLGAVIGLYVFARNLRALPHLQLGPYRFALVRSDAPPVEAASPAPGAGDRS